MEASIRHGISAGFHSASSSSDEARKLREKGYTFLGFGVDAIFLGDVVCDALAALRDH